MSNTNRPDPKKITGEQFDEMFDNGEDMSEYLDLEHPIIEHHPPLEKRVTFTMPAWMVGELDQEARKLAISRNAIVNVLLAERLRSSQQIHSNQQSDTKELVGV